MGGEFSPPRMILPRAILDAAGIRADCERDDEDMTSIMRRTVRGTAAGLGALAIVAGTAACGGLLEGDDGGDGPAAEQEDPAEGEGEDGADEEADPAETQQDEAEAEADADGTGETGDDSEGDSAEGDDAAAELTEDDLTAAGDRFYAFLEAMGEGGP